MNIALSDHFNVKRILRFTLSPIMMMIFTSLYGIVDGFFISNYAGIDEYAGVNLIMPVVMIIGGIGFMFESGGCALTGKFLGEQNKEMAHKSFTMVLIFTFIIGIILSFIGFVLINPICKLLGSFSSSSTGNMVSEAAKYGRVIMIGSVFFMLQSLFHGYLIVAEKPKFCFLCTFCAGITNIVFDWLFIAIFNWGVIGAAIATVMGYIVGCVMPLIYVIFGKNNNIKIVKTNLSFKILGQVCFNGCSEFVSNISSSIVGLLYNVQLLRYFGENGVSAYGTLMYVSFLFIAIFVGYSIGTAPVISYNFGSQNKKELSSILKKSIYILLILGVLMVVLGEILGPVFSKLYLGSNDELLELTVHAFKIFSIHFIFCGFSIFFSSFFTALNNGVISAIISFLRTLVLQIAFIFILPLIFGANSLWWCVVLAEICSCILSFIFLFFNSKRYGYFSKYTNNDFEMFENLDN